MDTSLAKGAGEKYLKQHEANAIKTCLNEIFDLIENGWANPGGQMMRGDLTLVDTRYATKAVFEVIKARGTGTKGPYIGVQGVGRSQLDKRRYNTPKKRTNTIRKLGDRFHIEYAQEHRQNKVILDADDSKLAIQKCLRVQPGLPGSLTLAQASESDHKTVSHHLSSEFYRRWKDKDGQIKEEWKQSGANHWLDCAGYAWVAGKILRWKIPNTAKLPPKTKSKKPSWMKRGRNEVSDAV